jgi:hypothetical protein
MAMTFAISLFAADPGIGVWKINLEKSTKLPSTAGPLRWDTITREAVGSNGVRETLTLNGKPSEDPPVTAYFDGKERPFSDRPGMTRIDRKIDDYHTESIFKQDGKEHQRVTITISPDGKTRTETRTGTLRNGTVLKEPMIAVYEKVN